MVSESLVSIAQVKSTVQEAVTQAMQLAHWQEFIRPGADVALKPNLTLDFFLPGAVTSPWVMEGVILTIRQHVRRIYIVESNQVLVRNVEKALRQTRIADLCKKYDVEWVNMSRGSFQRMRCEDGLILKDIDLPEILSRTQLITVPAMKTHGRTVITGAIKNQWGCLKELRHNYHPVVNEALADVNSVVKPSFAVMDATVGLEGNGPKSGIPRIADRVLASGDFVALDAVAAKIMGFDPGAIPHIQLCHDRGLGRGKLGEITIVGEDIAGLNLHFQPARNNQVAVVEMLLRGSLLHKLVFDTPLFQVFIGGALIWYSVWYYLLGGKRQRDRILRNPRYGPQWVPGPHPRPSTTEIGVPQ